jgi:rfaE bifunctional protein kinase chain/domain
MSSKKTILVLGDVMLDQWIYTDFQKISQETHVAINKVTKNFSEIGGAGNAARVTKFLTGDQILLMGVVGSDSNGELLKTFLSQEGIEGTLFVDHQRQTTSKVRIYSGDDPIVRIDDESTQEISNEIELKVLTEIRGLSPKLDGILLSDYGKGFLTNSLIREILRIARESKIPVVADPARNRVIEFRGCDVIKPNNFEWLSFIGNNSSSEQNWNAILDCQLIVVTKSEEGMEYYENGRISTVPGINVSALDITGAGDSAAAVLISGLLRGKDARKLTTAANQIAALFVTFNRTDFPEHIAQEFYSKLILE